MLSDVTCFLDSKFRIRKAAHSGEGGCLYTIGTYYNNRDKGSTNYVKDGQFVIVDCCLDVLRQNGSPKDALLECVTRRLDLEVNNVLSGVATM